MSGQENGLQQAETAIQAAAELPVEFMAAASGMSRPSSGSASIPGGGSGNPKAPAPSGFPKGFDPTKGFKTFDDFKDAFGAAGKGQAWHHIVEQTINSGKFAPELLHNPANLVRLPHGKGSIHGKISGYYSSTPPWTGGVTVREWISKKSFTEQFEFGIQTIKQFGGAKYLPTELQ
jgi:hypothetical protein